jgi:hypothetical protein
MVNHGHQPKPSTVPGGDISHNGDEASPVQLMGRQFYFEEFPGNKMLDFENGDIIQLAAKDRVDEYTEGRRTGLRYVSTRYWKKPIPRQREGAKVKAR